MTVVLDGAPAPVTVSGARRWWALGALGLAVLTVGIDGTVLSVALPTLAKALHASESDGMDLSLAVSAGIAVVGVVLTLVFLPASNAPTKTVQPGTDKDGEAAEKRPAITGQAA